MEKRRLKQSHDEGTITNIVSNYRNMGIKNKNNEAQKQSTL